MKKNMAKIAALMLVIVMVLSMTACASEQDKLVGTWEGEVDFASVFNESLGDGEEAAYLAVDSLTFKMVLTFTEEGTYSLSVDEASVTAAMESLKAALKEGMERYLVDMMAEAGMELNISQIMEMMGTTMDELVDQLVTQEMIDEMADAMVAEGNFKAKDGMLYMSDSLETVVDETVYETYTLEDDTLTLVTSTETDEMSEFIYPMVFTKAG